MCNKLNDPVLHMMMHSAIQCFAYSLKSLQASHLMDFIYGAFSSNNSQGQQYHKEITFNSVKLYIVLVLIFTNLKIETMPKI